MSEDKSEDINKLVSLYREFANDIQIVANIPQGEDVKALMTEQYDKDLHSRLYQHCSQTLMPIFVDVIYKNDKLFEREIPLFPGVPLDTFWKTFSDDTKSSVWRYLQLMVFMLIQHQKGSILKSGNETVMTNDFKEHFNTTFKELQSFVDGREEKKDEGFNIDDLCQSKIGSIAKEIAEETLKSMDETESEEDALKGLMSNPAQVFSLMKSIGTKLEDKVSSGEIKQDDIFKEAFSIMEKMKDLPGAPDMQQMFRNMNDSAAKPKNNRNATHQRLQKRLSDRKSTG